MCIELIVLYYCTICTANTFGQFLPDALCKFGPRRLMSGFAQHCAGSRQRRQGTWTPPPLHRQSVAWSSGQHGDLLRHLARGGNNKTVAFPYCCCFLILNVVVTRYCVLFLCLGSRSFFPSWSKSANNKSASRRALYHRL